MHVGDETAYNMRQAKNGSADKQTRHRLPLSKTRHPERKQSPATDPANMQRPAPSQPGTPEKNRSPPENTQTCNR